MDRNQLAKMIDHTLLKPEATDADVIALCNEAAELGTFSVCVSPTFVSLAAASVSNGVKVATVCGFPSLSDIFGMDVIYASRLADAAADVNM